MTITRISSREVYRNDWIVVREDRIRRTDGSMGLYSVVDKPSYALIIASDADRVRLVEQYRYPLGERRWEFPQGAAPGLADMEPLALAARELREETGLTAGEMTLLGRLDLAPGLSSQRGWVFLATDLREGDPDREHEEQDMRSAWFTRDQVEAMILAGEITDAQTVAAYAQLLLAEKVGR